MALLFMDGFDHYATAELTRKWSVNASYVVSATGRFGGSCLYRAGNQGSGELVRKAFSSTYTNAIVGVACKVATLSTNFVQVLSLSDNTTAQVSLILLSTGALAVYRGGNFASLASGTELAVSSTGVITANAWNYIELKVSAIDDSTGAVEVQVNGASVLTASSLDTKNTANAYWDTLYLAGGGGVTYANGVSFDDVYVCDSSGSSNNDFLGDVRVVTLLPSAAGDSAQFTPLSGANYTNVDEASVDDDTTYVESSTAGHKDLYALPSLAATPVSIFGVQTVATIRKDDAGAREARVLTKAGTTTRNGATFSPGTTYAIATDIMDVNPDDSAAWAMADIDGLQVGVEVVT